MRRRTAKFMLFGPRCLQPGPAPRGPLGPLPTRPIANGPRSKWENGLATPLAATVEPFSPLLLCPDPIDLPTPECSQALSAAASAAVTFLPWNVAAPSSSSCPTSLRHQATTGEAISSRSEAAAGGHRALRRARGVELRHESAVSSAGYDDGRTRDSRRGRRPAGTGELFSPTSGTWGDFQQFIKYETETKHSTNAILN
jgi:hypothetical protein